jgi:isoleucyl-tRNA synthetase
VLLLMTKVMAPFTPFICEVMYQNLRRCLLAQQQQQQEVPESVHFCDMPAVEQVRQGLDSMVVGRRGGGAGCDQKAMGAAGLNTP